MEAVRGDDATVELVVGDGYGSTTFVCEKGGRGEGGTKVGKGMRGR